MCVRELGTAVRIRLVLRFVALRDSSEEKEGRDQIQLAKMQLKRYEGYCSVYKKMLEKDKH